MMKLVHLSDLHFGAHDDQVVCNTLDAISSHNPDMVIVSGDFTQSGTSTEFQQARQFLQDLQVPFFCVPGNHDVPQRNIIKRFVNPYERYKEYITNDLCPVFENDHILLAGVNSARRFLPHWNWANGAVSTQQLEFLRHSFETQIGIKNKWRVCTFHHPVHEAHDMPLDVTVFGGKALMRCMAELKIDLVLTGHVHHASITTRGDHEHQCIYLSASTALSTRLRGHENGFNVITLNGSVMEIDIFALQGHHFEKIQQYKKTH
tara:strand:+ start:670 stop:1455 length:786 start_codon:yes stop_codon:yes gene_type:complete